MDKKRNIGQMTTAIFRNIQLILSSKLNDLDIGNGQYDFFLVISRNEGISQKQLSEFLHINKSTTAKAVKHLISKGYVIKEKDDKDGRMEHLFLSELGKKVAVNVQKIFAEMLDTLSTGFSESETETFINLLQRVLDNAVAEKESVKNE